MFTLSRPFQLTLFIAIVGLGGCGNDSSSDLLGSGNDAATDGSFVDSGLRPTNGQVSTSDGSVASDGALAADSRVETSLTCGQAMEQGCRSEVKACDAHDNCQGFLRCESQCTSLTCRADCADKLTASGLATVLSTYACIDTKTNGACAPSVAPCDRCVTGRCELLRLACVAAPGCMAVVACIDKCTDEVCRANCRATATATDLAASNNLDECRKSKCSNVCGGAPGDAGVDAITDVAVLADAPVVDIDADAPATDSSDDAVGSDATSDDAITADGGMDGADSNATDADGREGRADTKKGSEDEPDARRRR